MTNGRLSSYFVWKRQQEHHKTVAFKGTLSPGFSSFFVITVLIIQRVTLFHAQNVLFTAKARYQVNFRINTKLLVLSDFSKTQLYNLQLFQIAIHFLVIRSLKHLLIVWLHLYSYLQQNWIIIL